MKKYSEQVKPAAVEAYRTGELGWKRTAALHEVEPSSLRKWVAAFDVHGPMPTSFTDGVPTTAVPPTPGASSFLAVGLLPEQIILFW